MTASKIKKPYLVRLASEVQRANILLLTCILGWTVLIAPAHAIEVPSFDKPWAGFAPGSEESFSYFSTPEAACQSTVDWGNWIKEGDNDPHRTFFDSVADLQAWSARCLIHVVPALPAPGAPPLLVIRVRIPLEAENMCENTAGAQTPNPILPSTGEKYRTETDLQDSGPGGLTFTRSYRSLRSPGFTSFPVGLGWMWMHNHSATLKASPETSPTTASVISAEGYIRTFSLASGSTVWAAADSPDTLARAGNGNWTYHRAEDDSTASFSPEGQLKSMAARNGWVTTYSYNALGQLAVITNPFNRSLTLTYDAQAQLSSVSAIGGRTVSYTYDALGRLSAVTYPNGGTRQFRYEQANQDYALTSILDEAGSVWNTIAYDAVGRAISSELSGGVGRYQVSYPLLNQAAVTDPLGISRTYSYSSNRGKLAVTGGSLPSEGGQADAASRVQDANGLVSSEIDFAGISSNKAWDAVRRLPLSITQGAGTSDSRTVNIQWHPTLTLPTLITEAGRTKAYTYDALGNVLTETITHTATNKVQVWQWAYNAQSLVSTKTEPNGAITAYVYDTSGRMTKATNARGHETLYGYDLADRISSITAPNGLVTTYAYDARDRLLNQTIGGQQTTSLTYKAMGAINTVTLPTGLVVTYSYDGAHRLTGWSNNRGESGLYTLDAIGNRTAEQIKNGAGSVAWNVARTVNNLNRLSARTEGPNQTSSLSYDANGELVTETNGLNQSTHYGLNVLRRVTSITDAANATATLKYNALDAVTVAKDFKGVTTNYVRDAQGNPVQELSADTGTRVGAYDRLGLPQTIVNAMGQSTGITRDTLGRPRLLTFADGMTTALGYDATATSKGYLGSIVDRSGTTLYTRDSFGRVILKKQTLASGTVQQVSYSYNINGSINSVTYPGGGVLAYVYDTTGRLTQMNWAGQPLITSITWNPLGQPLSWTWAFADASATTSLNANRTFDTAGRMTATEFSSYVYNSAGRITGLTQNLYQPADAVATNSTIANANATWAVGYNAVGRIMSFNVVGVTPANNATFTYDKNGNRLTSTRVAASQTTARSYTLPSTSNRVTGFSQTFGSTTTTGTYSHNANGDLTGDGLNAFSYDSEGRMNNATVGHSDTSPTVRYAHNALGQRVFKTAAVYPIQGSVDPELSAFFGKGWTPATTMAESFGSTFTYDENGGLIAESTSGATNPGTLQYVYLPTTSGPMPIAAVINNTQYAVQSDHLNTPRRLTNSSNQVAWQWVYSAFGDEQPTTAAKRFTSATTIPTTGSTTATPVTFNLRYPGQYADSESGLSYNYFRSYNPTTGRYSQSDPIGLNGGWNRFGYVDANPLMYSDSLGLINQEARRQLNQWFGPKTQSGNCATAECAAGLTPAPSENRNQKEVDVGQCKMVCQISLAVPVMACNVLLGGGLAGTAAAAVAKGGACALVCK